MTNKKSNRRPADGKHPASKGEPHPHQQDMSGGYRPMQQQGEQTDNRRNMTERHGDTSPR